MSSAQNPGVIITNVIGGLSSTVFAALVGMVLVGASTYASRKGKTSSQGKGDSGIYSGSTNKTKMTAPSSYNPPYNPSSAVSRDEPKPTVSSVTAAVPVTQPSSAPEQEPNVNPNQIPNPNPRPEERLGEREAAANPAFDNALRRQEDSNTAARIQREREAAANPAFDNALRRQEDSNTAARIQREREAANAADRRKREQAQRPNPTDGRPNPTDGRPNPTDGDVPMIRKLPVTIMFVYIIDTNTLDEAIGIERIYDAKIIWSNNTFTKHIAVYLPNIRIMANGITDDQLISTIKQKLNGKTYNEAIDVFRDLSSACVKQNELNEKIIYIHRRGQQGGGMMHDSYDFKEFVLQLLCIYLLKIIRFEIHKSNTVQKWQRDILASLLCTAVFSLIVDSRLFLLMTIDSIISIVLLYAFKERINTQHKYALIMLPYFALTFLKL